MREITSDVPVFPDGVGIGMYFLPVASADIGLSAIVMAARYTPHC
jgi:hypothetical protein